MDSATIITAASSSPQGYYADGWILLVITVFAVIMIAWGAKEANDRRNGRGE
jgi:hypothetical protein